MSSRAPRPATKVRATRADPTPEAIRWLGAEAGREVDPVGRPVDEALRRAGAVRLGGVTRDVGGHVEIVVVYRDARGRAFVAVGRERADLFTVVEDGTVIVTTGRLRTSDEVGPLLADHARQAGSGPLHAPHDEITSYLEMGRRIRGVQAELQARADGLAAIGTALITLLVGGLVGGWIAVHRTSAWLAIEPLFLSMVLAGVLAWAMFQRTLGAARFRVALPAAPVEAPYRGSGVRVADERGSRVGPRPTDEHRPHDLDDAAVDREAPEKRDRSHGRS